METEDILAVIIISYFAIAPTYLMYVWLSSIYWLITKTVPHLVAHLKLIF